MVLSGLVGLLIKNVMNPRQIGPRFDCYVILFLIDHGHVEEVIKELLVNMGSDVE